MTTLLLRFSGPMQAWGTRSRFSERDSGLEPSMSGVIGLLCAALGRDRDDPLDDLTALRLGIRVDREGVLKSDYHTASGVPDASGKGSRTVLSNRAYLADAEFLVGLQGDSALLDQLTNALRRPRTQLFFGRKSFLPGAPVVLPQQEPWGPGIRQTDLESALLEFPWLGDFPDRSSRRITRPTTLRTVIDARETSSHEIRQDVPVSFAQRRFATRPVRTREIPCPPAIGGC